MAFPVSHNSILHLTFTLTHAEASETKDSEPNQLNTPHFILTLSGMLKNGGGAEGTCVSIMGLECSLVIESHVPTLYANNHGPPWTGKTCQTAGELWRQDAANQNLVIQTACDRLTWEEWQHQVNLRVFFFFFISYAYTRNNF